MKRRFPAEWEVQAAVIIAWPFPGGDFGGDLDAVEHSYQAIAKTILEQQELIILCRGAEHRRHIEILLPGFSNFIETDYNDIWLRDTGPVSIINENQVHLLNFQFNGWGGKYPHQEDNRINQSLFESANFQRYTTEGIDWVLEGGSIDTDGRGTLLSTRQCLLNPNRNPSLNKHQIEHNLKQTLGVERILWLNQAHLDGDDTDAHIDTLARFCNHKLIAYTSCENPHDAHYASLKNMEKQLQALRTLQNEPYQLCPLPLPKPIYNEQGQRLPANYANFLIINNAVLAPQYQDENDAIAVQRLQQCFPNRHIRPIPCLPIVQQYGSLHCMTMQIAASPT